jgi:hypothetical protein
MTNYSNKWPNEAKYEAWLRAVNIELGQYGLSVSEVDFDFTRAYARRLSVMKTARRAWQAYMLDACR